jgi:hypothetical protein
MEGNGHSRMVLLSWDLPGWTKEKLERNRVRLAHAVAKICLWNPINVSLERYRWASRLGFWDKEPRLRMNRVGYELNSD